MTPERALRVRAVALRTAVEMHRHQCTAQLDQVLADADRLASWLAGTTQISLIRGEVTDQQSGEPTGTPNEGDPVQIHDNEQFSLAVDTRDAKGFETKDAISWAVDRPDVVRLDVSEDGLTATVVALAPGSAIITVSDDTVGLSATEAVDVLVGGTATIALAEGPVSVQE